MHSRTKSAPSSASASSVVVVMSETVPSTSSGDPRPRSARNSRSPDTVAHPAEQLVVEALQTHLVAGHGEGLTAGLPHHARADDGDPLLFRPAHRLALACTQYMPSRLRPL